MYKHQKFYLSSTIKIFYESLFFLSFIILIFYGTVFSAFSPQNSSLTNVWWNSSHDLTWYQHSPDSARAYFMLGSSYLPLYYEWLDTNSVHEHDIKAFQLEFVNQYHKLRYGLHAQFVRTSLFARPVNYQTTHLQLSENRYTAMAQIPDIYNFTPSVVFGYNTTTESIDRALHIHFSGFHWLQPSYSYSRISTRHETDFRLYESELLFRDNLHNQSNTYRLQSPVNGHWRYTFSYSHGNSGSPGTDRLESQNLSLDTEERYAYLDLPSMLYLRIFGEYSKKTWDGSTTFYSEGHQFGKLNLIKIRNSFFRLGASWKSISYSYQHEQFQYDIFGQLRGAPFTGQAVDLLGTAFSIDSQGDITISTHLLSYSPETDERTFHFQADIGYNILISDNLDYRTYVLVFRAIPRRETLKISSLNLDTFRFFKVHVGFTAKLSQMISAEMHLQQLVPLNIQEKSPDSPHPKPFTSDRTQSYGGGAISLSFRYHF